MQVIDTIAGLRAAIAAHRRAGRTVGFVPTMGYLHQGHTTLVDRARAETDVVVTSIFVNPLQFAPTEDLARYPRDLPRDCALLEAHRCDIVFAPAVEEMYPRPMETIVDVTALSGLLEGERRPGHFRGVATVVAKLFAIVQPDRAYFGEKDYQQLLLIRRMVADLSMPIAIVGVPTVREDDGLACSSRNVFLGPAERAVAVVLSRSLADAEAAVADGVVDGRALERRVRAFVEAEPLAAPDLIAVRDADTLLAYDAAEPPRAVVVLLAVRFGRTRLLDQRVIPVRPASEGARP
ncbi:pantoate--beta-alanine ligase [Oharaeibacter diazotrophicus]|uniref:Pantothenate synthetase n=3 Tax=Oharaeibacter diazotrophicus TaxID=1920512 RepID=A0A4R6RKX4_9HYPH|nr:pantoate--beta-alanine ligase [Oharaeibacter diazotrophicus]TDP87301.1 pantothenate synthetase [Oharaeibacter diazotrophicus]BBE70755.1 pantothenate synthetase [Pleomorphomonas sp. SM30]GLS77503.1 pantothenate synthetase [Oharaeibacter diazotrophicus]